MKFYNLDKFVLHGIFIRIALEETQLVQLKDSTELRLFNRALKRSFTIFLVNSRNSIFHREFAVTWIYSWIYLLREVDVHDSSFIVTFSVDWSADGSRRSLAVAPFRNFGFILFILILKHPHSPKYLTRKEIHALASMKIKYKFVVFSL